MNFILIPIISALIGWLTNWVAVKMLFYPKQPRRFLFITYQGVFPKRQGMIAQKVGKLVADELLQLGDVKEKVMAPQSLTLLFNAVEQKMDGFLENKMSDKFPLLSLLTTRKLKNQIREELLKEAREELPSMLEKYIDEFQDNLKIEDMISHRFSQMSSDKLERVMNDLLEKEFRFIEIIGGVLGFLIGLLQVLLFYALG